MNGVSSLPDRSRQPATSPFVCELTDSIGAARDALESCFARLAHLGGRLWFDSASNPKGSLGRYSFLTADPLLRLTGKLGGESPWPKLAQIEAMLPSVTVPGLPPFQGGLAGLLAYESASWLEAVPPATPDDFATDAISVGLYDWVIACDHHAGRSWLISQGFAPEPGLIEKLGRELARAKPITVCPALARGRAEEVLGALEDRGTQARGTVSEPCPPDERSGDAITTDFPADRFRAAVSDVVDRIGQGESFQVNLTHRIRTRASARTDALYLNLRACSPAPFACFYDGVGFEVASSSPEGFLQVRDRRVETRPIKGTLPRSSDPAEDRRLADQLLASEKDHAENVMIVDLMRNDLSRACEDESVVVTQLCELEAYRHVQHLVSVVQARLRDDASITDLLRDCFPGGSITGAPKIQAMRTIAELEPHLRGPYCGSMGYISVTGDADFNILIRTITACDGQWHLPAGGGITALSDPFAEEQESWDKAAGMIKAIQFTRDREIETAGGACQERVEGGESPFGS